MTGGLYPTESLWPEGGGGVSATAFGNYLLSLNPSLWWTLDAETGATDLSGNGRNGTGTGVTVGGYTTTYPPIVGADPSCTNFNAGTDNVAQLTGGMTRGAIIALSPTLYWPLDSTYGIIDQSGSGRNGTAQGSAVIGGYAGSPVSGEAKSSTDLTGASQYISSTYSPFVNGGSLTLMGWARRDNATLIQPLVGATGGGNPALAPRLRLGAANTNVTWEPDAGSGVTTWNAWPGDNLWTHWALVFNEATDQASLYINGALVSTQTNAVPFNASAGTLLLGETGTDYWDGKIAHFAVFDYGLDATQVKSVYDAGRWPWNNGEVRTITGWVFRDNDEAAEGEAIWSASGNSTYVPRMLLNIPPNETRTTVDFDAGGDSSTLTPTWPGEQQWVYFAVVMDEANNDITLYYNGEYVAQDLDNTDSYAAGGELGSFQIALSGASAIPLDGKLGHVAIFDYALPARQIRLLYAGAILGYVPISDYTRSYIHTAGRGQ